MIKYVLSYSTCRIQITSHSKNENVKHVEIIKTMIFIIHEAINGRRIKHYLRIRKVNWFMSEDMGPYWPWKLTDDLDKQQGSSSILRQALCMIPKPQVYSKWSPETLNSG